jgi:hypothetical protein
MKLTDLPVGTVVIAHYRDHGISDDPASVKVRVLDHGFDLGGHPGSDVVALEDAGDTKVGDVWSIMQAEVDREDPRLEVA